MRAHEDRDPRTVMTDTMEVQRCNRRLEMLVAALVIGLAGGLLALLLWEFGLG